MKNSQLLWSVSRFDILCIAVAAVLISIGLLVAPSLRSRLLVRSENLRTRAYEEGYLAGHTRIKLEVVRRALLEYRRRTGDLPTQQQGLAPLLEGDWCNRVSEPLLFSAPSGSKDAGVVLDAFGEPISYSVVEDRIILRSSGKDKRFLTEDDILIEFSH